MRAIGAYSIKGGVGKSTMAVNLAWCAATEGRRTLLWDLDPQGAASYCLRVAPRVKGGVKGLLKKGRGLDAAIKGTDFEGLDLMPADFSYRRMDTLLDDFKQPRKRLRRLAGAMREEYDLLIFDCAPSISLTSENVFRMADLLLVPIIPSPLSMRTLAQLEGHLAKHGPSRVQVRSFFSMADGRKRLHKETVAEHLGRYPGTLRTVIPYASEVELMTVRRAPLQSYSPASRAGQAFQRLWDEVKPILWGAARSSAA